MKSILYSLLLLTAMPLTAQIEEGSTWAVLEDPYHIVKFENDTLFVASDADRIYEEGAEFHPFMKYSINENILSFYDMINDTICGDAIGRYQFNISNDTLYFDFSFWEDDCIERAQGLYVDRGFFRIELLPKKLSVQALQPPYDLALDKTRWWLYNYPQRYDSPILFKDSIFQTAKFRTDWNGRFRYLTKGDTIQFYEDIFNKKYPSELCDSIGLYTFEIKEDTLQFSLIADDCSNRILWFEDVYFLSRPYAENPFSPDDYLVTKEYTYTYITPSEQENSRSKVINNGGTNTLPLPNVYPNPSKENMTLDFSTINNGFGKIYITDQKGKVVFNEEYPVKKGQNSISLDVLSNQSSGVYIITLEKEDEELYWTNKIILTK